MGFDYLSVFDLVYLAFLLGLGMAKRLRALLSPMTRFREWTLLLYLS
jgi:hypothetical protein